MGFLFPVGAAILQAGSFIVDKITLSVKRMNYKKYAAISFPLIFFFTLIIFLYFRPPLRVDLLQGKYLLLLLLTIIVMIITNILFYRALKTDLLSEMEPLSLLSNIPLILFTSFFFADERNILIIIMAIITVVAVVWSHWERHHLSIAKKTWPYLIWSLLIAPFTGIISKILLEQWNPISLGLVRDGILALVFIFLFAKDIKYLPRKAIPLLLLTNLLTTIAWILYFFSYQTNGIISTVLIFSLQPLLVYFASVIFLKEKFHKKKFIAFLIILGAITAAQVLG